MEIFHPLRNASIGQPFKGASTHPGIDFSVPVGTDVLAAGDGFVAESYTSQGHLTKEEGPPWSYGERIIITHADGSQTTYNHLSKRDVSKGDIVSAGQKIGESGNTGYSFGPHLHFEYRDTEHSPYSDPALHMTLGEPPILMPTIDLSIPDDGSGTGKLIVALILFGGIALATIFILKGS